MNLLCKIAAAPVCLIQKAITKVKLIYLILLIVFLSTAFLVVEGITSHTAFNRTQRVGQDIFTESVLGLQSLSQIKDEVYKFQADYLKAMNNNSNFVISTSGLEGLYLSIPETEVEKIRSEVNQLKSLAGQPLNNTNYALFAQHLEMIKVALNDAASTVQNNSIQAMTTSNKIFEHSRNINITILIVSLILSLSIGLIATTTITGPLKQMVTTVGRVANGDFTTKLEMKGSWEVNQLVDGLNSAMDNLRQLVANVSSQAQTLASDSTELSRCANDSGNATSEVARVMEEMAQASTQQTDQVSQAAESVAQLGKLVREVSKETAAIANASTAIAGSAQVGQKITGDVNMEISDLYTTTHEISLVINEMNNSSEKIQEITAIIENIAGQTSLLALNAAIEAARAGEHGRGFGVVAQETGKLAEESKQASQKISDLVAEMINRSAHAVATIHKGLAKVEAGKALTTKATVTFESIFNDLSNIVSQINQVAVSAQKMAERNETVIKSVTSVAAISQENVATIEELSATAEEQNAAAEQVAELAENLSSLANRMKQSVSTFKV